MARIKPGALRSNGADALTTEQTVPGSRCRFNFYPPNDRVSPVSLSRRLHSGPLTPSSRPSGLHPTSLRHGPGHTAPGAGRPVLSDSLVSLLFEKMQTAEAPPLAFCSQTGALSPLLDPAGAAASAPRASQIHHPTKARENANKSEITTFWVGKRCSNSDLARAASRIHRREIEVEIFAYVLREHLRGALGSHKAFMEITHHGARTKCQKPPRRGAGVLCFPVTPEEPASERGAPPAGRRPRLSGETAGLAPRLPPRLRLRKKTRLLLRDFLRGRSVCRRARCASSRALVSRGAGDARPCHSRLLSLGGRRATRCTRLFTAHGAFRPQPAGSSHLLWGERRCQVSQAAGALGCAPRSAPARGQPRCRGRSPCWGVFTEVARVSPAHPDWCRYKKGGRGLETPQAEGGGPEPTVLSLRGTPPAASWVSASSPQDGDDAFCCGPAGSRWRVLAAAGNEHGQEATRRRSQDVARGLDPWPVSGAQGSSGRHQEPLRCAAPGPAVRPGSPLAGRGSGGLSPPAKSL